MRLEIFGPILLTVWSLSLFLSLSDKEHETRAFVTYSCPTRQFTKITYLIQNFRVAKYLDKYFCPRVKWWLKKLGSHLRRNPNLSNAWGKYYRSVFRNCR